MENAASRSPFLPLDGPPPTPPSPLDSAPSSTIPSQPPLAVAPPALSPTLDTRFVAVPCHHSPLSVRPGTDENMQSVIDLDTDGSNQSYIGTNMDQAEGKDMVESDYELCDKPYINMEFKSEEAAFEYYNTYARKMGFGIRKDALYRSKKTHRPISRRYVCCKEGYKEMDKRKPNVQNPRRHTREGCKALLSIKINEYDKWIVQDFIEEHNHQLATPSKTGKLRSHRENCVATQSLITKFSETIGPSKITNVLNTLDLSGGVTLTQQQTRDYLKKVRRKTLGSECMHVVRSFKEKNEKDVDFFFDMEIDEEYTMRSVFWIDGRSRRTYEIFGDVVVFDTTYKTNNLSMPFAPFTGVNHHGQSTLLVRFLRKLKEPKIKEKRSKANEKKPVMNE